MSRFQREKEKLRNLSRAEKIDYLWTYYKLWIIAAICAVLLGRYFIGNYIRNNRDDRIYTCFVNTSADLGEGSSFYKGYLEFTDTDPAKENVNFDTELYFTVSGNHTTGNYYYEKFVLLVDSGRADAVVMDEEELKILGERGRLMDLSDQRTNDLMEKYRDRIVTAEYKDEQGNVTEVPVGIDISDSNLITEEKAFSENCVIGIAENAQHIDEIDTFLRYIYR